MTASHFYRTICTAPLISRDSMSGVDLLSQNGFGTFTTCFFFFFKFPCQKGHLHPVVVREALGLCPLPTLCGTIFKVVWVAGKAAPSPVTRVASSAEVLWFSETRSGVMCPSLPIASVYRNWVFLAHAQFKALFSYLFYLFVRALYKTAKLNFWLWNLRQILSELLPIVWRQVLSHGIFWEPAE